MERSLNVLINNTCVGRLRESNGLWAFAYTQAWLGDPNGSPLCPLLPLQAEEIHDGATVRPVQWFFDNLLPEEGQRILIARAADTTVEDAFAYWRISAPNQLVPSPCCHRNRNLHQVKFRRCLGVSYPDG